MARFFFHVLGYGASPDNEGVEFDTALEAHDEAVRTVGEMMQERGSNQLGAAEWSMVVMNEAHDTVCRIKVASEQIHESAPACCASLVRIKPAFEPLWL